MSLKSVIRTYKVKKSAKRVTKSRKKAIVARSKRVGVEFGIKSKQNINGKIYYADEWVKSKTSADKIAKEIREYGDLAKVIVLNRGYGIYIHYN
jgi:hypothetical protein